MTRALCFVFGGRRFLTPQKAQKKIRAPGEKGTHDPTSLTSARLVPMFDCYVSVKLAAVLYYSVSNERAFCIVFDCY